MSTVFIVCNVATGLAYFFIAWKLFRQARPRYGLLGESVVFGAFILMCGVHHMVMLFRHPMPVEPVRLVIDIALAFISVFAAAILHAGRIAIEMRQRDRRQAGIADA